MNRPAGNGSAGRVLVVEDDEGILEMLKYNLSAADFSVQTARDGVSGLRSARTARPDLILLDLMLPGMSGFDFCRALRKTSRVPIIVITAKDAEVDKIVGLELGADDYLPKPFDLEELLARLRAVFRRDRVARQPVLEHGELHLDPATQRVARMGVDITLNRKEYGVLEYLMRHPDKIVSQEELLDHVWDSEADPFTNTVRVHIMKLRRKINDGFDGPTYIQTVVGRGYRL
jgi:DNA-binding response OmpR family regulator